MRVLVVDDEDHSRERLKLLLGEAALNVQVVGEAKDGLEALEAIGTLAPEVVFLDISMPHLDGIGVAETLGDRAPLIVFITAHDDRAIRAFEVNAVDYLLKPVNPVRLAQTLMRLQSLVSAAPRRDYREPLASLPRTAAAARLAFKSGAKYRIIAATDIVAIEARDDYAALLTDDREILVDETLEAVAGRLGGADFFVRVHRSAVINLSHLQELVREGDRKYTAVMRNHLASRIAVSRERLPELKERLGLK